jgi:hypothetical protein
LQAEEDTVGKRIKKPPVRPELARSWLRRYESDGESVPQIARADGYDVRTVRIQLDLMRQEREVREAKQTVLRQAMEKHYVDLCSFAEKLKAQFQGDAPSALSVLFKDDPMWRALREHMPRSPLWKDIDRWTKLEEHFRLSLEQLKERIRREAKARTSLEFVSFPHEIGLVDGFIDALVFHLRSLSRGYSGLRGIEYSSRATEEGVWVHRGAFSIAIIPEAGVKHVEEVFDSLLEKAPRWREYSALLEPTQEFLRLQRDIREELTKIILKRVVTGRCTYCPF